MHFNPDALITARERAGLTQDELGKRANLAMNTIWHLEAGRSPSPRTATVEKVAKALGLHWAVFFEDSSQEIEKEQAV